MLVVTPRQCLTMASMQLCKSSSYIARLTATLRPREGAWFQSCWDNARICPSIGVSGYKGLDWFCLTPTCPSCEQLPPEQNMSECFVQDLWLRLALGWQERTKLLAFSYLCTEKQHNGDHLSKLFWCWEDRTPKARVCQQCRSVVCDMWQLR